MLDFIQIGDLHNNRDSFIYKVEQKVGKNNWLWAFKIGNNFYTQQMGMQIYEDSFWMFLFKNKDLLKDLILNYKNVYRNGYEDFESGLDYNKQNGKLDHFDDIALRRVVARLGFIFRGNKVLDIKNSPYSELKVPFHLPEKYNTVKSWYDATRYLVIATEIEDKVKFSQMLIK